MTKFARLAALAAAATLVATPVLAAPVSADPKARASARIVRPLTLTAEQDLDFGTIIVDTLTADQTVTVSRAGVLGGCTGALTCSGTVSNARYNVTGSNNINVRINSVPSDLINQTSGGSETLTFTPDVQASILLSNSGAPGNDFNVGGAITLTSTTVEGVYQGDIEVTVDY